MTSIQSWFVLAVRGGSEQKAKDALEEKGFECFLPMYKRLVKRSRHSRGKGKKLIEPHPLLYGYVFSLLDEEELSRALQVDRVYSVLKVNDQPVSVRPNVIEDIRSFCDLGGFDEVQQIELSADDQVVVSTGPVEGFVGKVVREPKSKNRIDVEINGFRVVSTLDKFRKLADIK